MAMVAALTALLMTIPADAQGLKDILGGGKTGSTVVNALQGIFSKSDITVADMAGEWRSSGPAVSFKSDNFLQKAGGIAGAAAIESQLEPYYEQYGLNGMILTIDPDGNFTMKVKKITLKGVITPTDEKGAFLFKFQAFGKISLGSLTTYAATTGKTLDIMFDATKLKQLITTVANISGMKLAKAAGSILESYDGACIGFKMDKTGNVSESGSATSNSGTQTQDTNDAGNDSTTTQSGLGGLMNLLKNGKNK